MFHITSNEKKYRRLYSIGIVMMYLVFLPHHAFPEAITTSHVFQVSQQTLSILKRIQHAKEFKESSIVVDANTRHPRHVWQKAYEALTKIRKIQKRDQLPQLEFPELDAKAILPSDVLNLARTAFLAVAQLQKTYGLDHELPAPHFETGNIHTQKILVVDDNQTNRELQVSIFSSWKITNDTVSNGITAIKFHREAAQSGAPYTTCIIDMQMPPIDGVELARRIKSDPLIEKTLLVLMSSQSQKGDAGHAKNLGFSAFLPKPIQQSDLYNGLLLIAGKSHDRGVDELITKHMMHEYQQFTARILAVEDNSVNQLVIKGILQKCGLHVDLAANGVEALVALKELPYDVVFMDCQMPEMDGFEATRRIRASNPPVKNPQIPIIALTANALREDKQKRFDAGMNDYIPKPIELHRIKEILNLWLPESKKIMNTFDTDDMSAPKNVAPQVPAPEDSNESSHDLELVGDEQKITDLSEAISVPVVQEILKKAPESLKDLILELKQGVEESDIDVIRRAAHTIKGTCESVGAIRIVKISADIEASAADMEFVQNNIDALEHAATETIEWWSALFQKLEVA